MISEENKSLSKQDREQYWLDLEESLLVGGAAYSEWCNFIAKDTYTAFIHGADLSSIVMSLACIETYLKTENPDLRKQPLSLLIDNESLLSDNERQILHKLRRYRNKWVHMYDLNDDEILENEASFSHEAEEMSCLAVKMLLTILFIDQFI